jgi:hypothetical protein
VGDWDGDGTDQIGLFRSGTWYLDYNGGGSWDGCGSDLCLGFGRSDDKPLTGRW